MLFNQQQLEIPARTYSLSHRQSFPLHKKMTGIKREHQSCQQPHRIFCCFLNAYQRWLEVEIYRTATTVIKKQSRTGKKGVIRHSPHCSLIIESSKEARRTANTTDLIKSLSAFEFPLDRVDEPRHINGGCTRNYI